MGKISGYLQNVKYEFGKLSWPSRKDAARLTAYVIGGSLLVGFATGGLDLGFSSGLRVLLTALGK